MTYQFHIKALSSLALRLRSGQARLRQLNLRQCTPRSLNPRRLEIILDLELVFRQPCPAPGFALTELITVLALIGIMLGLATMNFHQWQVKSGIERQTRELFTDINAARSESIFRKTRHRITFQPNSYVFKRYSSEEEDTDAGTILNSRRLPYGLTREAGQDISDYSLEFDMRGLLSGANFSSANLTLRVNPVDSGAAFDCIIIHTARTNMGKMEQGTCNAK